MVLLWFYLLSQNYQKSHYTGGRMVIAAAGGVNHDELVSMSRELFGKVPSDTPEAFAAVRPEHMCVLCLASCMNVVCC